MDILSHGLWGGITVGRKSKKSFWTAFAFGVAPDAIAFGPMFADGLMTHGLDFFENMGKYPPAPSMFPAYVHSLYNVTHSLLVFAAVFAIVWFARRKPLMEMWAWALHVFMDIFTHNSAFFPTPFLWPVSDFHVNGIPWGSPIIFFPNVATLAILYAWFGYRKLRHRVPKDPLA